MNHDLIGLLGALGQYWDVEELGCELLEEEEVTEDLFYFGGRKGFVYKQAMLIRPRYLEYIYKDWQQGMSIKRLAARYPVLRGNRYPVAVVDSDVQREFQ